MIIFYSKNNLNDALLYIYDKLTFIIFYDSWDIVGQLKPVRKIKYMRVHQILI